MAFDGPLLGEYAGLDIAPADEWSRQIQQESDEEVEDMALHVVVAKYKDVIGAQDAIGAIKDAGIKQVIKGIVDFGGSDVGMTPEEVAQAKFGAMLLPMTPVPMNAMVVDS